MANNGKMIEKVNKSKRAQAALDYLMSWGWVLIIIVLVLVILFSLGVFKAPSAPTIISGFKGITMQAAEANSTMMVVKITNNYNQFVNITGITVNVNGNAYTAYSCLNTIISTGQSTLCRVPVVIPTTSYLSKIQISFTPYKSSIYEVSNGTVSSTLLSGAIPINNQLTYFVERGLPYGSTFTVNYNTSTNSTTVSSVNDNVSFNLPFGNYYFSVPTVTYQGCTSLPNPSAGYHSTGVGEIIAFTSNCTTTFSETGLPSGQSWQVTFNGTTKSNSTGSAIQIKTNNTANTQVYYTATAKSNNLACVSYKTPSIRLGESYTFSAWNCTTTFTETGLPSGESWYITNYNGVSSSVASTGSQISILEKDVNATPYTASASGYPLNQLNCNDAISAVEGSSDNNFNPWKCTTTFTETALPSSGKWNASYNGSTDSFISVGSNAVFTTYNVVTVENYPASAISDNLNCNSQLSSVQMGSTPWTCITTFSETGLPSNQNWYASYNGNSPAISTGSPISVKQTGITIVSAYTAEGYSSDLACDSYSTPAIYQGSSYTFDAWNCTTTFTETGLPSNQNWYVTYDSISPNPSASTGSGISAYQTDISQISSYNAEGYSSNLKCNSYSAPSVAQGSSYTFDAWNCTTTFVESGVPLGATGDGISGTLGWTAYYPAGSKTAVASSTSSNTLTYTQTDITSVSENESGAATDGLTCGGDGQQLIYQGGTADFTSWICITDFSASQLEPGTTWNITLGKSTVAEGSVSSATSASLNYEQKGITSISTESFDAVDNQLDCSVPPNTVYEGGSTSFLPSAWECTTTITFFGVSPPCPSDEGVDTGCNTSAEEFSFNWSSSTVNYHYNMIFPIGIGQVSKTITTHFMSGDYHYCTGIYGNYPCTGDFNYNYNSPVNNSIVNCLYNRDYLSNALDTDGGSDILGFSDPVVWTGNTSVGVSFVPGIPQILSDSLDQTAGCYGWDGQDYAGGDTNGN
ncbi:MAG: hypothetical protein OH338_04265 [Candidatus Parvarchaeota archaeon]|nr:hypothetical protein [Candidatus Parvarchaeum tengchongense]